MADAIHYAAGVRSAALGKQTRQPIVKAFEYWLDSGERMKKSISIMLDDMVEKEKDRPEDFRRGIEPKVDSRTAEKVAWANSQLTEIREEQSWRIITAELKNPQPFPVGDRINVDTDGISTSAISNDDYLLTDDRSVVSASIISGEDYRLNNTRDYCPPIAEGSDDHVLRLGEEFEVLYDYDYTLVFTRANGR